jgi:transcription elongation factor SPT6
MSTRDFFDVAADVGSDEDEDFDEETGEARPVKKTNGTNGIDDSSEEEDEDDDELLAQASHCILSTCT